MEFNGASRSALLRSGVGSLILKGLSIASVFGVTVVLARKLGTDGYGVYSFILALISIVSIPAAFGLPSLVIRETARALTQKDWRTIKGIWRWSGIMTIVVTVMLVLIVGALVLFFSDRFDNVYINAFLWSILLVPLISLGNLRGAALQGLNKIIQGQMPEKLFLPGINFLLVLIALILLPAEDFTPKMAIALQVIAAALAFLFGAILLWRATPATWRQISPTYQHHQWLKSALPLAFVSGLQLVISRTSIVLLGLLMGPSQVGIYRVADQISVLIALGLHSVNVVVAPQFARLYARGDNNGLQRMATSSARVAVATTLPIALLLWALGKPTISLIFGAEYLPVYGPLSILAIGQIINSITGSNGFLLNMTGYEQDTVRGLAIAAISNIILNLVLIPFWGVTGAAVAAVITMATWNILLYFSVRRHLKINSMAFRILDFPKDN